MFGFGIGLPKGGLFGDISAALLAAAAEPTTSSVGLAAAPH